MAVLDTLAEVEVSTREYPDSVFPQEQEFLVKYLELESVEGVEQSLVQILDEGIPPAVTVCLGQGPGSKNSAARLQKDSHVNHIMSAFQVRFDVH